MPVLDGIVGATRGGIYRRKDKASGTLFEGHVALACIKYGRLQGEQRSLCVEGRNGNDRCGMFLALVEICL